MVEFHRFGDTAELLSPSRPFLRTMGWDGVTREVAPTIKHDRLEECLDLLRYDAHVDRTEVEEARATLASLAKAFLPPVECRAGEVVQIDLVTNAAELWALPFEASFLDQPGWLASAESGVELTRRIRGEFAERSVDWPDRPKILFLHAPTAPDLDQALIDAHVAGLESALLPWSRGKHAAESGDLIVRVVWSAEEMAAAVKEMNPTYVHVLAHGAPIAGNPRRPRKTLWGLRLSSAASVVIEPAPIADALAPAEGRPFVVTLAACDSGNQSDPVSGAASLAQELHRRGVPVVVASQFPLTQERSPILARSFYSCLCRGEDVRVALHAARVALKEGSATTHDWLSLVGYVRLPEGYAQHLLRVRLKAEMGMLDALQQRMEQVLKDKGPLEALDEVESQVRLRLQSLVAQRPALDDHRDLIDECNGLAASTCKRLAELRFVRGQLSPQTLSADRAESRQHLEEASKRYREAYDANVHSHWLGVQQIALEAVVNGSIEDPDVWAMVRRAAALARDATPPEGRPKDYWSGGTLVELFLLCPLAGRAPDAERTREAVTSFLERVDAAHAAGDRNAQYAVPSTRRQLSRYVTWWTKDNGFFPGRVKDLAEDAKAILAMLG
jgi:hypothetical protein